MSTATGGILLDLTHDLLTSIEQGDWARYAELCDESISCFEPEGNGHLIEGMGFHRFYFDLGGHMGSHNSTISSPHVRMLGKQAAVVSYVRLVQSADAHGQTTTHAFEESRVWHQQNGAWKHVHFHRSRAT